MSVRAGGSSHEYHQGFRDALGMVVRGLLAAEAERVGIGELIVELSRYEERVDAWLKVDSGEAAPIWQPTAEDLGAGGDGT